MNDIAVLGLIIAIIVILPLTIYGLVILKNKEASEKTKLTTKQLMYVVNLTALATVLGFLEIPLGTIIPGGKFDFSEVIVLIAFLVIGYKKSLILIFLRSFIRFFIIPSENEFVMKFLGEIIAIAASVIIMTTYMLVRKILKKDQKPLIDNENINANKVSIFEWFLNPVIITCSLVIILTIFHYFITVPISSKVFGFEVTTFKAKMALITPFTILNIIKGILSPIIFLIVRQPIEKMLK